jgi:hypothetical protein
MSYLHRHIFKIKRTLGFYSIRDCSCGQVQSLVKDVSTGHREWVNGLLYDLYGPVYVATYNWQTYGGAKLLLTGGDTGIEEGQLDFLINPEQVAPPKRPIIFFFGNWWENEIYQTDWFTNYLNRYFSGE